MSIYKFFNKPTKEHLNDGYGMYECKLCEPAKFVKATIAVATSSLIKHLKIYHESHIFAPKRGKLKTSCLQFSSFIVVLDNYLIKFSLCKTIKIIYKLSYLLKFQLNFFSDLRI